MKSVRVSLKMLFGEVDKTGNKLLLLSVLFSDVIAMLGLGDRGIN